MFPKQTAAYELREKTIIFNKMKYKCKGTAIVSTAAFSPKSLKYKLLISLKKS